MTDRELEQRLAAAVEHTAPNDLEAILSRCGVQNGSVMELKANQSKNQKKLVRWLAAACAALVLVGGGSGVYYHQSCAVASVVSLDVNPSIELKVNRNEKVISCTALNEEAAAVLFSMSGGADLKGAKLEVAVNAIVGALVQAGYLDSVSSAILISVEDNDQARAARLQQELVASVDGVLQTQAPGAAVLSQVLTADAGTDSVNTNTSISSGKAALVQKVLAMNGAGDEAFERLAALSVEELNDLLETGEKRIPIGKAAASIAAETYAGTLALDSVTADVDPELDDVPPHYEVELRTAFGEFEYKVDAFTGEILSGQKDIQNPTVTPAPDQTPATPDPVPETPGTKPQQPDNQTPGTSGTSGTQQPSAALQDVGEEAAKQAALDNAGLSASDVTNWKIEREWDDGQLEYEIEFWCGTTEYDYTIHGHTCAVIKCGVDHHRNDTHHNSGHHGGGTTAAPAADIGQEAAKKAALDHAGVAESQTTKMKVEQDWDDGRLEYEVEFESGSMEYEYTIDGATGAVLEYEWDD